jgi:hypothetical protein
MQYRHVTPSCCRDGISPTDEPSLSRHMGSMQVRLAITAVLSSNQATVCRGRVLKMQRSCRSPGWIIEAARNALGLTKITRAHCRNAKLLGEAVRVEFRSHNHVHVSPGMASQRRPILDPMRLADNHTTSLASATCAYYNIRTHRVILRIVPFKPLFEILLSSLKEPHP